MQVTDYEMTKEDANGGTAIRNWLNALFGAVVTQNSGNEAPTTTYAFMWWYDTSNSTYYYLKQRTADNSAWNTIIRYKVADKTVDFMLGNSALSDLLTAKADASDSYTIDEVNTALGSKAPLDSPVFTGNVGIGGTTTIKFDVDVTGSNARIKSTSGWAILTFDGMGTDSSLQIQDYGTAAAGSIIRTMGNAQLRLGTNNQDNLILNSSGLVQAVNSIGIGYGVGSGGTVTQATSKSTAISLNKPSGRITMNAASLSAKATVSFAINNTTIGSADTLTVSIVSGASDWKAYDVWGICQSGAALIAVYNRTDSALAEELVLEFNVIKGAIS